MLVIRLQEGKTNIKWINCVTFMLEVWDDSNIKMCNSKHCVLTVKVKRV